MTAIPTNVVRATRADVKALAGWQLRIVDRDLLTPPGSPANDARYLMPAAGTILGAWAAAGILNGEVAHYIDGAWERETPADGWRFYIIDEGKWVERISGSIVDMPTKAYVDGLLAANDAFKAIGALNCSGNPNYPAADAGHVYKVSVAGRIGGAAGPAVDVGDILTCWVDSSASGTHAAVGANWTIQEAADEIGAVFPASVRDGSTNDRAAIAAADTLAAGARAIWMAAGVAAIATSLTISSPLFLEPGAVLKPASGAAITLSKNFTAGPHQIFDLSAGGTVVLPATLGDVRPEWFGVTFDNSTDDATKLSQAAAAANAAGLRLVGYGRTAKINSSVAFANRSKDFKANMAGVTAASVTPFVSGLSVVGSDIWDAGYPKASLAGSENRGDNVIALASGGVAAAGLQAGDKILIWQNTQWAGHSEGKKSEWALIIGISGENLTLAAKLEGSYTSAATVRKMPAVDVDWEDIEIIGAANQSLNQFGAVFKHCRSVKATRLTARGCDQEAFYFWENWEVNLNGVCEAFGANDTGLGYGFSFVGNGYVHADTLRGTDCKHVVTGGAGETPNYPLQRKVVINSIVGVGGADALFDMHFGCVDAVIGSVVGTLRTDTNTAGDGFVYQGSRLQAGLINVVGYRRYGFLQEFYGDGDGSEPGTKVESLVTRGTDTGASYSIYFTNQDATNHNAFGHVQFDHVDCISPFGAYFRCDEGDIGSVEIGGGAIKRTDTATAFDTAVIFRAFGAHTIPNGWRMNGVAVTHARTDGQCVYSLGTSSASLNGFMEDCRVTGADVGVRADYGEIRHSATRFGTHTSLNTTVGTNGVVTPLDGFTPVNSELLVASAVTLVNGTAKEVLSLTVPAGPHYVFGILNFVDSGGVACTGITGWIHDTTGTPPPFPTLPNGGAYASHPVVFNVGSNPQIPVGGKIFNFTSPTPVYLVGFANFTGGTSFKAYGRLEANQAELAMSEKPKSKFTELEAVVDKARARFADEVYGALAKLASFQPTALILFKALEMNGFPMSAEEWAKKGDAAPEQDRAPDEVRALHRAVVNARREFGIEAKALADLPATPNERAMRRAAERVGR